MDGEDDVFGGALALAYYAEPRGTLDVDVNVFVPLDRTGPVLALLDASLGFVPEAPVAHSTPDAGIRLRGPTMYPRLARLRTMIRQARPPDS